MSLSTKPYKGSRDFYPEDKRKQEYMFRVIREQVSRYGYEEYDAPIIESLELYQAKSGEEIVNDQTYKFTDRGGREVAIRPEMTPSVSRMVAARRQENAYPLRWFSIPNLWRYERPQRGRLREHWQLNVDIFGEASINAELELIMLTDAIFQGFKADRSTYVIKINHRQLIDRLLKEYLELDQAQAYSMMKLLDRMHKLDKTQLISQIDEIFNSMQKANGLTEKLLAVLSAKDLAELPNELIDSCAAVDDLRQILATCSSNQLTNVIFDISVIRGFDYYSGIVFELNDTHPDNSRSMMGGGRYDGLVGLFGVDPIPTAGFGLGDATLANFLELHGLMPELDSPTDIYLITPSGDYQEANKVAKDLRDQGLNIAIDYSSRKIGEQIKTAVKKGIRFTLIVGPNEINSRQYTLRDLKTTKEGQYSLGLIGETINKSRLKK